MTSRVADALRGALTVAFGTARWIVDGLDDDEYFWEPLPDCWAVRRREDARTPGWGTGEWVCEDPWPHPDPPPFTNLAWRLCHLCAWTDVYRDWTFGAAQLGLPQMEVPGDAASAVAWLHRAQDEFSAAVAPLDDDDLTQLRPAHFGVDLPVQFLVGAIAREHTHHGAEIGVLRDLRRGHAAANPRLGGARVVPRRLALVKVRVDTDLCTGHGRCYALAPDVFGADDFGHCEILIADVDGELAEHAKLGAENCPEHAITVED